MHGFREGQRTGTTTLESKPLQQLLAMRKAVLFEVFLDLQKAYDTLDWDRCLEILVMYRVAPGRSNSFERNGTDLPGWQGLADTLDIRSKSNAE